MAWVTVPSPVAMSPAIQTLGRSGTIDRSADCPSASRSASQGMLLVRPVTTGRRRPLASGSPSSTSASSSDCTRPSPPTRTGWRWRRSFTPSATASSISGPMAGISLRPRR